MVKKKRGRIRRMVGPFVNFPRWMGADALAASARDIKDTVKQFGKKKNYSTETFEEAVVRLQLSEGDIKNRMRLFKIMAFIYLGVFAILVAYFIHLFLLGHVEATIITFLLIVFVSVLTYRESLWYVQMKNRKLGCTFKEWKATLFGGR